MSAIEASIRKDDPVVETLVAPWKSVLTLWSMPFLLTHALLSASFATTGRITESPVRRPRSKGQMNDAQLPVPETLRSDNDRELFA